MLDFTSALYLGFRHESRSLRPWSQLTRGVPAALTPPSGAVNVARELAALQGCEDAILAPSTLHLFWDLFGILSTGRIAIYMDEGVYPIMRWGVERSAARGVPVREIPHYDAEALRRQLKRDAASIGQPVIVTDGFCPGCGKPAPVTEYLESIRAYGGFMIIDDTQALGILGHSPSPGAPYGIGGGGSLRWSNAESSNVLMASSLAKGFGVPVAVLAGSNTMIRRFRHESYTRVYCSPPSVVAIYAAKHALDVNHERGESLRLRLARLVRRFRLQLAKAGLSTIGRLFPIQVLKLRRGIDVVEFYEQLLRFGIRTVLSRDHLGHDVRISFLITVLHKIPDIDRAADIIAHVANMVRRKSIVSGRMGGS